MAHTIGALKRMRQNKKRNLRNTGVKSEVKTQIKKVLEALKGKQLDKAREELRKAESLLDRAASGGVLHPNNAARRKARLAAQVNALAGSK